MKVPELSNIEYSHASLPADLQKYSYAAKFAFLDLFPALHGRAIYLDPDVIVQGIFNYKVSTCILEVDILLLLQQVMWSSCWNRPFYFGI